MQLLSLVFMLFAQSAVAEQWVCISAPDTLNVRSLPSSGGEILTEFSCGTCALVSAPLDGGNWVQVLNSSDGSNYYTSSGDSLFLNASSAYVARKGESLSCENSPTFKWVTTTDLITTSLSIREEPTTESPRVQNSAGKTVSVMAGEVFTAMKIFDNPNWVAVQSPDEFIGFSARVRTANTSQPYLKEVFNGGGDVELDTPVSIGENNNSNIGLVNGRPPMFVMMSFDGGKSNNMWRKTREFANSFENRNPGKLLEFTYFLSAPYMLTSANKNVYTAPGYSKGRINVSWSSSRSDVQIRLGHMRAAAREGHLLGSHAVGHFNGDSWSESQWNSENAQFLDILMNAYRLNGFDEPSGWRQFVKNDIRGFRAPLLGRGETKYKTKTRMYKSLVRYNLGHDASDIQGPGYWPRRESGIWNFPLGWIPVKWPSGKTKGIVSMDYNASVNNIDPNEMLKGYIRWFNTSYRGNRAPLHIGHHFAAYGGRLSNGDPVYWDVMKRFAEKVCGLPEVICGNYEKLAQFMNKYEGRISQFTKGVAGSKFKANFDPRELELMSYGSFTNGEIRAMNTDVELNKIINFNMGHDCSGSEDHENYYPDYESFILDTDTIAI